MAPKPTHALLAVVALTGLPLSAVPLALAQSADPPVAAPMPLAAPPPPPPVPEPRSAVEAPSASEPIRPEAEDALLAPAWVPSPRLPAAAAPTTPDVDQLIREGALAPNAPVRVRGMIRREGAPAVRAEACRSGALSQRECGASFTAAAPGDALDLLSPSSPGSSGGTVAYAGGSPFRTDASPLAPISVPVTALLSGGGGSFRLTDVFRVTPRPSPVRGNNNLRLLYPLIGSAVTSSNFGWRLHPVLGTWLMHAGRDLAAPEGTPVVAALSGRVVSSGVAGGYGLAVEVEHDRPRRRTLYGHLSELYVKEGDTVRQGEVIGRVGSTGLSTGPHLHFELRQPQDGGWVAVDPGDLDAAGPMLAGGLPGAGPANGLPTDAVALLMGQLIQSLERPRSPLPLPGERLEAKPAAPKPAAANPAAQG